MKILVSIVFILLTAIVALSQTAPSKYKNDSEVPRISLKDAKQAFDDGTAVFVDARSRDNYKENHIKGAISIPFSSTDNFDSLPKGKKIIVYCSWPSEHTSAGLALQMNNKGIANVVALAGGTRVWQEAKYPMVTGDKP